MLSAAWNRRKPRDDHQRVTSNLGLIEVSLGRMLCPSIPHRSPSIPPCFQAGGYGGGMEGLRWGDGHYPEDATLKCLFLTTCLTLARVGSHLLRHCPPTERPFTPGFY